MVVLNRCSIGPRSNTIEPATTRHGGAVKVHKVENHTALPHEGIPEFMAKLRQRGKSSTASALEFCILTATRTTETLGATAREIDLANAVWTIPAERMKMGVEHRIPLVGRALEIAKKRRTVDCCFRGKEPTVF